MGRRGGEREWGRGEHWAAELAHRDNIVGGVGRGGAAATAGNARMGGDADGEVAAAAAAGRKSGNGWMGQEKLAHEISFFFYFFRGGENYVSFWIYYFLTN